MSPDNRIARPADLGLAVILLAAGCAPAVQTQQQRLAYVTTMGARDSLKKSMSCNDVALQFQRTEQSGIDLYDWYVASGCGAKSDYVTKVSQQHWGDTTMTSWTVNIAATEDEFKQAAEQQLKKTAAFDLGCKELEYTTLHSVIAKDHSSFESSIGASGCGKKASYHTACALQGLKEGQHDIVCQSLANTAAVQ